MPSRLQFAAIRTLTAYLALWVTTASALDLHRAPTQYVRTVWTQADGLPQDTIRRISQTTDGYLWLATEEGLTRFDGYDFVTFTKNNSSLPSNSITGLAAGRDGILWIGTSAGLIRYRGGQFKVFTSKDGLPDNGITSLLVDEKGVLWIGAGIYLSCFDGNSFTNFRADRLLPLQAVRVIYEDRQQVLWFGGIGGIVKLKGGNFVPVVSAKEMDGSILSALWSDVHENLWIGGSKGVVLRAPDGRLKRFDVRNGLPDNLVVAFWQDRSGEVWVGTKEKLSRIDGDHFVSSALAGGAGDDWIRCLFEDREGNLWVGMNSGLSRLRDGLFTVYSRAEGLPSDEPKTVRQDRGGDIWVGYYGEGLVALRNGAYRAYTIRDGLPSNGIFSIRESHDGGLLISTRGGLSWEHGGKFSNYVLPDPLARPVVYDALQDHFGRVWVAGPGGVYQMTGNMFHNVIPGGPLVNDTAVVLSESPDGSVWAGTYANGLWQVKDGKIRQYTLAYGIGSDRIRSLYPDQDGTLWIGTFGGGLSAFRDGVFSTFASKDGLLSDNVSHIEDDGDGSLWLSTPRGICRVVKQQLLDFRAGRIKLLKPLNYGVQEGLPSAQSAPGYAIGGGGTRTQDGRLWFTTTRGLAVIDPKNNVLEQMQLPPIVQFLEVTAEGHRIDLDRPVRLKPGTGHVQFRYAGIHLSAPERVSYSYQLEGLDRDWIAGDTRRVVDYNGLGHGRYRFLVRATVLGQSSTEAAFDLEILPHFYERKYFLWLCVGSCFAAIYGLYQFRVQQIRSRFSLVLEERARMAREIHDTLAQGFVGISRQLDAISRRVDKDDAVTQQQLELAQKMTRYSITEARRSVTDLRASLLEDRDLPAALTAAARQWTAAQAVPCGVDVVGTFHRLPADIAHNVLRIFQEAVTNALKHADASQIWICLRMDPSGLLLTVDDNGRGFEPAGAFVSAGGHFGLLGMRERAERLGGALDVSSQPGRGTRVRASIPLSSEDQGGESKSYGVSREGVRSIKRLRRLAQGQRLSLLWKARQNAAASNAPRKDD